MAQPHGGANAKSGVSAQGYLVVSGDHLFVPTGRAVPASFDRLTGKFEYFHLQKYGHNGGAPTMAVGDMFFNSGISFNAKSGEKVSSIGSGQLAATSEGLVGTKDGTMVTYRWVDKEVADRKGNVVTTKGLAVVSTIKGIHDGSSLIVAKDKIISGGNGFVDIVDMASQKVEQSLKIDGNAYGLAVAYGRLQVTTDEGAVYCFSTKPAPVDDAPTARISATDATVRAISYDDLAEEIIRRSNVTEGYCLDLGCGDGGLSLVLANKSKLHIIAVDDDLKSVEAARTMLMARGLYGSRVTVLHRKLSNTGLPRYFANLIVSQRCATEDLLASKAIAGEASRLQRPFGGTICSGTVESLKVHQRGDLEGAGQWTHQYADAGNTLNSGDSLVTGKLGMLWFRDVDFDVPQRHGRAPAPLSNRGRLFHEGINGIVAVDAYNGRELWRYEIKGLLGAYDGDELMGVAGTGSNFCVHDDSVYIRDGGRCLRIDANNGKVLGEFKTPAQPDGKPGAWGYIACVDGMLFGSVANREHIVTYRYRATSGDMSCLLTESHSLFAMDAKSGEVKWRFDATDSIRHNAIAIGDGKVCLIDRPLAMFDRVKKPEKREHPTGQLHALDAKTGEKLWMQDHNIYGTTLALSEKHKTLLMSYQPTRFRLDSEVGGRITAYKLADGSNRWEIEAKYESRPMINDRIVYTQGGAWDLLSGEAKPFNFKRSYGCGILAGSKDMMFFRSATLGYFSFKETKPIENYGGMRPGCWVNAIPAGGIVLVPDASAGCRCSYLNKAWIALDSQP